MFNNRTNTAKQSIRFLSLALSAIITISLLSCSKSATEPDVPADEESTIPLVFSPMAGWNDFTHEGSDTTKASGLVNNSTDLQNYSISLLANATREGIVYPVFKNHSLDYAAGTWSYEVTKYWITGAVYRFAAFAPYAKTGEKTSKTISNGTVDVTGTDSEPSIRITDYITGRPGDKTFDARSEDLVFAEVVRDNTDNNDYSTVPLNFSHLLSCVSFYVRNATNEDIESIDNIKLGGIEYKCNINIGLQGTYIVNTPLQNSEDSSPYFTGDKRPTTAESTPFLPKGMAENEFKPLFDCTSLTLLPQNISGKEIEISFTTHHTEKDIQNNDVEIEVNYSGNLGAIEGITRWQPGKKYRYNITISSQEMIFQVAEVPWIKHEVEL